MKSMRIHDSSWEYLLSEAKQNRRSITATLDLIIEAHKNAENKRRKTIQNKSKK